MGRDLRISPRWLDAAVIAFAAALMLAWTWRTWPDPLVDFGRELYVPWQMTQGRVLYRDLAYFNGPLSPHVNAALMSVFGVGLTTLMAANLAVLAAVLGLAYALFDAAAGRAAALTGALVVVTLLAFGRVVPFGNYNFLCPYSHEITHGIALTLAAMACLHLPRHLRLRHVAAAGVLLGLTLLTKVEMAIAATAAVSAGFALRAAGRSWPERRAGALALAAGALAPPLAAFAWLSADMPVAEAMRGTLGSIYWATHSSASSLPFYRSGLGTADLPGSLRQMGRGVGEVAGALAAAAGLGFACRRLTRAGHAAAAGVATLALATVLTYRAAGWLPQYFAFASALPVVVLALLAVALVLWRRQPSDSEERRQLALGAALAILALGLLAKMALNARLFHYGFVLALPGLLLLVATLVAWWPRLMAARGGNLLVTGAVGSGVILATVVVYLQFVSVRLADQRYTVGAGRDSFQADARGRALDLARKWVDANVAPEATLMVLPEGLMLNYLTRRTVAGRYTSALPPELAMFGEADLAADLAQRPPDFIALVHRNTTEYGVPLFGRDYGQGLAAWVHGQYREVALFGERPLEDVRRFGILLLQRQPPGEAPPR